MNDKEYKPTRTLMEVLEDSLGNVYTVYEDYKEKYGERLDKFIIDDYESLINDIKYYIKLLNEISLELDKLGI